MRRIIVGTCAAIVALGIGWAGPAVAAPVPVTALTCDGDTYKCTANLRFGDNNWKAGWGATIQHVAPRAARRAPVPVTALTCDGDTGKCTATLQFGDGNWRASWPATIYHQAALRSAQGARLAAPVPANSLTCDGDTGRCSVNLQYGDGNWKANWAATIYHP
ncbi:hypothetical protein [Streptomyces angustmyceticus]|uniref:hypothetical protein n=1 Tax=Streptomyces angustmyceticus TaxID=285578 RepID=UPI0021AF1C75|nr:hypothetical protein [Streptomyces angustmyceticus]